MKSKQYAFFSEKRFFSVQNVQVQHFWVFFATLFTKCLHVYLYSHPQVRSVSPVPQPLPGAGRQAERADAAPEGGALLAGHTGARVTGMMARI